MIRGLHGMFHSSEWEASRAFLRDKLRLPFTDVGGGWLIFDLPEADVGVHPAGADGPPAGTHDVSFYCDDIRGTVAELRKRGVEFTQEPVDQGYSYVTYFRVPGGIEVQLYEPKYQKRSQRPAAKRAAKKAAPARKARSGKRKAAPRGKTKKPRRKPR